MCSFSQEIVIEAALELLLGQQVLVSS